MDLNSLLSFIKDKLSSNTTTAKVNGKWVNVSSDYQRPKKETKVLGAQYSKPSPTPTAIPTVTPPPDQAAEPYYKAINNAASQYGVPQDILYNLIRQESHFNPNAQSGVGATGIAQFMPATAEGMGLDPTDPMASIEAAAKYLRAKYDQHGSWENALAAYNAGSGNVNKYGGIPPFPETQHYVKTILGR